MASPFTIQNVPFGIISTKADPTPRGAVAIDDHALELAKLFAEDGPDDVLKTIDLVAVFRSVRCWPPAQTTLNAFAELPKAIRSSVRLFIIDRYQSGLIPAAFLVPLKDVTHHLPMDTRNFVDYFCSLSHGLNCAAIMGGEIGTNFYSSPLCYNGRATSVIPSPSAITRPSGMSFNRKKGAATTADWGPSNKIDFELEMGFLVSKPLPQGRTLRIDEVPDYIFGFVLLNDWSARDFQDFEMRPLGPFHSKGFATTISPWVVTLDSLEPFTTGPQHDHVDSIPQHYRWKDNTSGTFNIELQAHVIRNGQKHLIAESNLLNLYWSPFQQLTHLASAGCGMQTGDLIGTGTISGEKKGSQACLLEATWDGENPIPLGTDSTLTYLQDGDELVLSGWCRNTDGSAALGFGECRGLILPAANHSSG